MKRIAFAVLATLLLTGPGRAEDAPAAKAAPRYETILPDDALAVFLVDNVPDLLAKWEKTPFGETWNDPSVKRFLAPLRKKLDSGEFDEELKKDTGMSMKDLLALFKGQMPLSVSGDIGGDGEPEIEIAPPEPGKEAVRIPAHKDKEPDALMLADIGGSREAVEKLLAKPIEEAQKAGESLRDVPEEFQGETLHLMTETRDGKDNERVAWAVVGSTVALARGTTQTSKAILEKAVSALKKGEAESGLAASANFKKVKARAPRQDVLWYVDMTRVAALAKKKIDAMPAQNPMGMNPAALWKALGLDVLQAGYAAVTLGETSIDVDAGLCYSENRGIVKLLTVSDKPCSRPAFLPADALGFSSVGFSVKGFWAALEELLTQASPGMAGMLQMGLGQLNAKCGVDLKKDLLGNLGDEMFTAKVMGPVAPGKTPALEDIDTLIGISVADKQGLETALEGLKGLAGGGTEMFEKRDYLGTPIQVFRMPTPGEAGKAEKLVAYAVTDKVLLVCVGSTGPLESALAALAKPGASVWDRPEVVKALETLPPGAIGLGFEDIGKSLAFPESLKQMVGMMDGAGEYVDATALPDAKAVGKHWGTAVSGSYRNADGLFLRLRLLNPAHAEEKANP